MGLAYARCGRFSVRALKDRPLKEHLGRRRRGRSQGRDLRVPEVLYEGISNLRLDGRPVRMEVVEPTILELEADLILSILVSVQEVNTSGLGPVVLIHVGDDVVPCLGAMRGRSAIRRGLPRDVQPAKGKGRLRVPEGRSQSVVARARYDVGTLVLPELPRGHHADVARVSVLSEDPAIQREHDELAREERGVIKHDQKLLRPVLVEIVDADVVDEISILGLLRGRVHALPVGH